MRVRYVAASALLLLSLSAGRAFADEAPPAPTADVPAAPAATPTKASSSPWSRRPVVVGLIAALFLLIAGAAGANDKPGGDKKPSGDAPPAS